MSITNDVEIGICGNPNWGLLCKDAATAAAKIVEECEWFGLAGGQVWFEAIDIMDLRIIVH